MKYKCGCGWNGEDQTIIEAHRAVCGGLVGRNYFESSLKEEQKAQRQKMHWQATVAAMQGLLSGDVDGGWRPDQVAPAACECADALIKEWEKRQ